MSTRETTATASSTVTSSPTEETGSGAVGFPIYDAVERELGAVLGGIAQHPAAALAAVAPPGVGLSPSYRYLITAVFG